MNKKINFKGSVVLNPVPVVLITSKNSKGNSNVFTVGWIGTVCTRPPMLSISIRPERLSYEYIKETMEFTVNLPTSNLTKAVDYCGVRSGKKHDKIMEMGLSLKDGINVSTPYIDECPISIECKVKSILPLGSHDLFIAEVVGSNINESLLDNKGKIHFEKADLITYCHGEYYKMDTSLLGTFGYSIAKKKETKEELTTKKTSYKKSTSPIHKKKMKLNTNKEKKKFTRRER